MRACAAAMAAKPFGDATRAHLDWKIPASIQDYRDGSVYRIAAEFVNASGMA